MSSFIGWLDYSEADQRQVRELLRLFDDKGTVDDLGIGTIRDAISNQLFPGTSVIQTRARYFLFVPWIQMEAERRFPDRVIAKAEDMERRLITALKTSDDQDGLIGRQAGTNVQTLPSTIYWNGLATMGVFNARGMSRAQYGRRVGQGTTPSTDLVDELTDRTPSFWNLDIPSPPAGFFGFETAELRLTRDEADWLSARMLSTEQRGGPNLLAGFVRTMPTSEAVPDGAFWDAELPPGTPPQLEELASHAARFSFAVRGATLLYNLMLAERRDREPDRDAAESIRSRLVDWAGDAERIGLPSWGRDTGPFFAAVIQPGIKIPAATRAFVTEWGALLAAARLVALADSGAARSMIQLREAQHKRAQARFGNPKRLEAWGGESGTAPLEYRWPLVRRYLRDIHDGLHQRAALPDLDLPVSAELVDAEH